MPRFRLDMGVTAAVFGWAAMVYGATVTLERIDGSTSRCEWIEFNESAIVLDCGQRETFPIDDVARLTFRSPSESSTFRADLDSGGRRSDGAFAKMTPAETDNDVRFYFSDGGMVRGVIRSGQDDAIIVDTSLGSGQRVALSALSGIWFGVAGTLQKQGSDVLDSGVRRSEDGGVQTPKDAQANPIDAAEAHRLFDEFLANREAGMDILLISKDGRLNPVKGRIVRLDADGGRLLLQGKELSFDRDRLVGIVLAKGLGSNQRWPVRVELVEGDRFAGRLVSAVRTEATFRTSYESDVTLPLNRIATLDFESSRIVYLSDLSPMINESTGLLTESTPARFDRSASDGPISLSGRVYRKGIGVHARSVLEYEAAGQYETFAATIGIDDAVRPRGLVSFQVLGDGRELFNSGPISGRDEARPVSIDLSGVRLLTLIVDFADGLDLSDHADWADARLIKRRQVD